MTLNISHFSVFPLTRDDAKRIVAASVRPPAAIDFSDVKAISHCFADELFMQFLPEKPVIVNASPFVERIASAARRAAE